MDTLHYAADRGVTFWDTADVYGTCMLLLALNYLSFLIYS